MTSTIEEPTFVKAFLSLLDSNGSIQLAEDYISNDLSSKPLISLPEMPKAKVKRATKSSDSEPTINVNLKSIKPPKFTTTMECKTSDTVYSIKEKLTKIDEVKDSHLELSSFRLLVKGRVATDSKLISEIVPEGETSVNLTVMIKKKEEGEQDTPKPSSNSPDPDVPFELEKHDDTWNDIKNILTNRLGQSDGDRIYEKMRLKYYS